MLPGSGLAEFNVRYRAVVWRPFKGETVRYAARNSWWTRTHGLQVDAIVTSVNQVGFFADAGPLPLFVSSHVGKSNAGLG